MRITLVAFDDFTDVDLFLAWDLLRRVPELDTRIVASKPTIRSSTGIEITVHGGLDEIAGADGVYVASGRGARAVVRDPDQLRMFAAIDPARQVVAAVDSGTLIVAALGLLTGKRATTYPSPDLHDALAGYGVRCVAESLVIADNLATAAQCLAGVDLVAWMISRLVGADAAERAIASVRPLGSPSR